MLTPPAVNRTPSSSRSRSRTPSVRNTTTSSQQSEDKDEVIARLSANAAIQEAGFVNELSHISTQLANVSDELFYWKETHASLIASHDQLKAQLEELKYEIEEREDADREAKTRISSLQIDRETWRQRYEELRESARERNEENEKLRAQITGLKRWVSSSGRSEVQVTDEAIAEAMSNLGAGLQNWVLKNYRKAKLKALEEISEEVKDEVELLCPTFESLMESGTAKVHLIQSLVSRILVSDIFSAYFFGLPKEKETMLKEFESWLASTTEDGADVNQWRAATLGAFNRSSFLSNLVSSSDDITSTTIQKILLLLGGITTTEIAAEQTAGGLQAILTDAISLSRLLRVQKAGFSLLMPKIEPHQITTFDAESMDDIGGEDEESLVGKEIACITFPGIIKEGDENGDRVHLKNVIAKAKVLCMAD